MVCERLHIICGNCGAIATNTIDDNYETTDLCRDGKYILCDNCGTLHNIAEILPTKKQLRNRYKNATDKYAEQKGLKDESK